MWLTELQKNDAVTSKKPFKRCYYLKKNTFYFFYPVDKVGRLKNVIALSIRYKKHQVIGHS